MTRRRGSLLCWLLELHPERETSPGVFEVEVVRLSTHGLVSQASDSIGITSWPGLLQEPPQVDASLDYESSGANITWGAVAVSNPPVRGSAPEYTRELDDWHGLLWEGRKWVAYRGYLDPRTGQPPSSFDEYAKALEGIIDGDLDWEDPEAPEIVLTDRRGLLDRKLDLPRFLGLGDVLRLEPAHQVVVADYPPIGDTWSWGFKLRLGPGDLAMAGQRIVDWGDTTTEEGLLVVLNATGDGRIRLLGYGLSQSTVDTASGVLAEDNAWHQVDVVRDHAAQTVQIALDGQVLVTATGVTGSIAAHAHPLTFGGGCTCWATAWRLTSTAPDPETLRGLSSYPADPEGGDLNSYWRDISAAGDQLLDEVGGHHGAITGATAVYGGEGRYDHAGTTKPSAWGGPIWGLQGFHGDPTRWLSHVHFGAITAVHSGTNKGLELVEGDPNGYHVDLDAGTIQIEELALAGTPGLWRWEITGHKGDGTTPTTFAEVAEEIATTLGGWDPADIDSTGLASLGSEPVGIVTKAGEEPTLGGLLGAAAKGLGGQLFIGPDGALTAARLELPTGGEITLYEGPDFVDPVEVGVPRPTLAQAVQHSRTWDPMREDDLALTVDPEIRSRLTEPWRKERWPAPEGTADRHPRATDGDPVESPLVSMTAGRAEARRRQTGPFAPGVHIIRLSLVRWPETLRLGQPVMVVIRSGPLVTPSEGRPYAVKRIRPADGPAGVIELLGGKS